MTKKQKIGLGLLVVPIPALIVILLGYGVANFVVYSLAAGGGGGATIVGTVINMFLGFAGILAILGIIIGMPVGAILLAVGGDEADAKKLDKKEKS